MPKKRLTVLDLQKMKQRGERVVWVTAYDFITAQLAEQAGIDMLLVGDSLGMCIYGYEGTQPVTMDQCICHTEAVRRAAPKNVCHRAICLSDRTRSASRTGLPTRSVSTKKLPWTQSSSKEAGLSRPVIRAIAESGMLVMGHLGLTPQSSTALGGFKAQARTADAAMALIEDAHVIHEAGAFAILIEAVPPEVTKILRDTLPIPVYSLGGGVDGDGQLMIVSDLVGHFQAFTPKFVKRYGNVAGEMTKAFEAYAKEVREAQFPGPEHTYRMVEGELPKLLERLEQRADSAE